MRLSALFEEFCHFLRVEKEATPATIAAYRWCFGDFEAFVMRDTVKVLLRHCDLRALMAYGGLRRGEVAALDVGDVASDFGLRRVKGKGGHEASVNLPAPARAILREYMASGRAGQPASAPLFVVTYKLRVGQCIERRITGQRIWKVVKAVGVRAGLHALHPHALSPCVWRGAPASHEEPACRAGTAPPRRCADDHGLHPLTQQDVRRSLETLGHEGE